MADEPIKEPLLGIEGMVSGHVRGGRKIDYLIIPFTPCATIFVERGRYSEFNPEELVRLGTQLGKTKEVYFGPNIPPIKKGDRIRIFATQEELEDLADNNYCLDPSRIELLDEKRDVVGAYGVGVYEPDSDE